MKTQEAKNGGYSAKDGLLWKDGVIVSLPEADSIAQEYGFIYVERLVKALEEQAKNKGLVEHLTGILHLLDGLEDAYQDHGYAPEFIKIDWTLLSKQKLALVEHLNKLEA